MDRWILACIVGAALSVGAPVLAELNPEQQAVAQAALGDFTAVEFAVRQQAVEKLVALGPDVVPLVRKLFAETTDNEVKLRCEMTLKGLAARWGIVVDLKDPAAPVVANLGPSKISLTLRDTPLRDVLDTLAQAGGNTALLPGSSVKDKPVTLVVKDVTYWEAVEQLCRVNGLMLGLDPATTKPAVVEPEGALGPAAVAGPVAITFNSASVSRTFRIAKSTNARSSSVATVSYSVGVYWEDRVNISTVTLQFRKLLAGGKDLLEGATQPVAQTVTPGTRARNFSYAYLSVAGVPEGTRRFDAIEGVVKVACRLGEKSVKLDDVFAGPPRAAEAAGVALSLKTVSERRKSVAQISVEVKREVADDGISLSPQSGHMTFALVDPKGARYPATVENVRLGGAKKTGRKNRLGQDETDEQAEFSLRFWSLPVVEGPWSLVLAWPEKVDSRDYPFRAANVPVP